MAEDKKLKNHTFVLPAGPLVFPKVNAPDFKFKKDYGEYTTRVRYPANGPEIEFIRAQVAETLERAKAEADAKWAEMSQDAKRKLKKDKNITGPKPMDLVTEEYEKDSDEPTGTVTVKASANAGGIRKKGKDAGKPWSFKPPIFDAKGKSPLKNPPEIWGGTIGKLSVDVSTFWVPLDATYGVKLNLRAVRILDLKSGSGADAASYGFGDDDEGFEYQAPTEIRSGDDSASARHECLDTDGEGDF